MIKGRFKVGLGENTLEMGGTHHGRKKGGKRKEKSKKGKEEGRQREEEGKSKEKAKEKRGEKEVTVISQKQQIQGQSGPSRQTALFYPKTPLLQ